MENIMVNQPSLTTTKSEYTTVPSGFAKEQRQLENTTMHDLLKRIAELTLENKELKKENSSLNAELEALHSGSNKNGIESEEAFTKADEFLFSPEAEQWARVYEESQKVIY